ncbi:hypothetical protein AB0395_34870 [Streptosporangium sp. NPDC051023]|uniref:hypothetical protein n=1 Tax=Streptosporangium sp. NPDC051023 TaxID=3155410 RepID=UPI0034509D37
MTSENHLNSIHRPGAQVGDIAIMIREENGVTPIVTRHAILAALRQAGLLPADNPQRDARDIAEFKERDGKLHKPTMLTLGNSGNWWVD